MIVTNSEEQWARSPIWRVGSTPRTVIGSAEGDEGQALFRIRSALVRQDGSILVANRGSNEIRVFDSDGRYLESYGGEGRGPGEFRTLSGIIRLGGDSIVATELTGLAHVFHIDGVFGRQILPDLAPADGTNRRAPDYLGVFSTGEFLVTPQLRIPTYSDYSGPYRDTMYLSVFDSKGRFVRSLGRFLGREMYWHSDPVRNLAFPMWVPYGLETLALSEGDHLYIVDNRRFEIQVRSPAGELETLIRKEHREKAVRGDDVQAYREVIRARLVHAGDQMRDRIASAVENALDRVESPRFFPPIQDVTIDTQGCVWVREYGRHPSAPNWTVFGPDGVLVGRARLPAALQGNMPFDRNIYEIGQDYVIGSVLGDDGVESIHVYTLERSAEPVGSPM